MYDSQCAVVGGGLAGAACALELVRNGRPTLVFERSREAHHKVCGEFLSFEAQALLAYLGIDVTSMGASKIGTLRLIVGNRQAEAQLPFEGTGLSRFRLDEALLDAAIEVGADVRRGANVTNLEPDDSGVFIYTDEARFRAGSAALATGKHALRRFPRKSGDMVGFKLQVMLGPGAAQALQGVVQLVGFAGGYIGACFVEDGLVTLCWVVERRLLKKIKPEWPAQSAYFSQQSEIFGDLLSGAKPAWDKPVAVAGIPYGYLRTRVISPRIYPLGDQLGVIPSFTGDGMAIALYSGISAAQSMLSDQTADTFQAELIAKLRPQFRWATTVNLLFETRLTRRLGIAMAANLPGVVTRIAQSTRIRGFRHAIERD